MRNKEYKEGQSGLDKRTFFRVAGAGDISISNSPHWLTGSAVGFDISISWASGGFSGGVIGRGEAKKLAEFILEKVNAVKISEEDEYAERMSKNKNQ